MGDSGGRAVRRVFNTEFISSKIRVRTARSHKDVAEISAQLLNVSFVPGVAHSNNKLQN